MPKGQYDEAMKYYNRSLAIRIKNLGPHDPSVALSYNNIGIVFRIQGNYEQAVQFFHQSLRIKINTLGPDHRATGDCYINLGIVFSEKQQYDKALDYYEKGLTISLKQFKTITLDVAGYYNNIGITYQKLATDQYETESTLFPNISPADVTGRLDKALEFHKKALNIRSKIFEEGHPLMAMSYTNIGTVYLYLKDYERAIQYNLKAIDIYARIFGKNYPHIGRAYNNIALTFLHKDDHPKTLQNLQYALMAIVRNFNNDDIYANPVLKTKSSAANSLMTENINDKIMLYKILIEKAEVFELKHALKW
ncbi:tetratricopeptide repeat protein [Candidatus Amoebophilus asiaticus]|nr:tetratricopeptide repeat protein [Candidatus Amoebophilus asiaticus]